MDDALRVGQFVSKAAFQAAAQPGQLGWIQTQVLLRRAGWQAPLVFERRDRRHDRSDGRSGLGLYHDLIAGPKGRLLRQPLDQERMDPSNRAEFHRRQTNRSRAAHSWSTTQSA